MIINGIPVTADPALSSEEITVYVEAEAEQWKRKNKEIARMELSLDGDEVIIKAVEKSPVRRVRRITGYLSSVDNFNDAKRAECADRVSHIVV